MGASISLCVFFSCFLQNPCGTLSIDQALKQSNIIAIAHVDDFQKTPDVTLIELSIVEQLYGDHSSGYPGLIIKQNATATCPVDFEVGQTYLVYGVYKGDFLFETSTTLRTTRIEKASKDLTYWYDNLTCSKEEIEKIACPSHRQPVCGCDGTTYDNSCLARNSGISWWKKGKCK